MTILDDFTALARAATNDKLAVNTAALDEALRMGDSDQLSGLRAARIALLGFVAGIVDGDRLALIAQWPAGYPDLPEWFTDPESVGEPGPALVVECRPAAPPTE